MIDLPLRTKLGFTTLTLTNFLRISTWAVSPVERGTVHVQGLH